MIDVKKVIEQACKLKASDIHFITGMKPMIRYNRDFVEVKDTKEITKDDIWDVYDFFLRGNIERDKFFRENKVLDVADEFEGVRLRINASYADEMPVIVARIIRDDLPKYETLGVPDIVRRMTKQTQGLILVTGKTTTLNALIDHINSTEGRKILTLESPVEFRHKSKKSIIVQKEVGVGGDVPSYAIGTRNSLREDCDILVIGEIRDRETMEAAIETAESGHLVIATLHTKTCAETIDRMINFYEINEQTQIKLMIASLLKLVISQRLIKNKKGSLSLLPEVMVVDNIIAGIIRKEKLSVAELEDAIQAASDKGNISLINSLARLFVKDEITLDVAKSQIEEKNAEVLNRTIMQYKAIIENGGNIDVV